MQKDCHRVIIVLTPEYIKDHWSICKAYMVRIVFVTNNTMIFIMISLNSNAGIIYFKALHSMVENGTKIIFIVTPGARKVLNSVSEQSKTTLLKAMKVGFK